MALENKIHLDQDGIIRIQVEGIQDTAALEQLYDKLDRLIKQLRAQNKKIYLLSDTTHIDMSSGGKDSGRAARKLFTLEVDRWALVGNSKLISFGTFLARSTKPSINIRHFRTINQAKRWLKDGTYERTSLPRRDIALIAGVLLIIIGLTTLVGWQISNRYLVSLVTTLQPINPLISIGILLTGVGMICYWKQALTLVRLIGASGVLLGIISLLPLDADRILYNSHPFLNEPHSSVSNSAALCFIAIGICAYFRQTASKKIKVMQLVLASFVVVLSAANIFVVLYARGWAYALPGEFVMAFFSSAAFFIAGIVTVLLVIFRTNGDILIDIGLSRWATIVAIIALQVATYGTWSTVSNQNLRISNAAFDSETELITNSIESDFHGYVHLLKGFEGLFKASTSVSEGDFSEYYKAVYNADDFGGVRSLAYSKIVKTADINAYLAERRADKTLFKQGHPDLKIQSLTNDPVHYIVTYIPSDPTASSEGLDLNSIPGRKAVYDEVLRRNEIYASPEVNFTRTAGGPPETGFFITVPVKTVLSTVPEGFVSINFSHSRLVSALFNSESIDSRIDIEAVDSASQRVLLERKVKAERNRQTVVRTVPIINQSWTLRFSGSNEFGLSASHILLPNLILAAGQILSLLLVALFYWQFKARDNAIEMAQLATTDLQNERNTVLSLHQKDEAIIKGISDGLIVFDADGHVERINTSALSMLGKKEADLLSKNFAAEVKAFDENGIPISPSQHPISKALETRASQDASIVYEKADGSRLPVRTIAAPILIDNHIIGGIEIFNDITKQLESKKEIERQVEQRTREWREEHAKLEASIDSLPMGFLIADSRETILTANDALKSILNLEGPRPDTIKALADNLDKSTDLLKIVRGCMEQGKPKNLPEVTFGAKVLRIYVAPIIAEPREKSAEALGCVILLEDITDRVVAERSKDEFFSIASHELRTPLTAIRGNSSMMLAMYEAALSDPILSEMVNDIHDSSKRLIDIVNDFLDVSRIEQGKIKFVFEEVDLIKLISKVSEEMAETIENKKLKLELSPTKPGAVPNAATDANRVKQILYNLLGNAVKFTDSGKIKINVEVEGKRLKISVADTGRGIPVATQKLLFHKFQQASNSILTRDTTKGTGLGLYISKLLVDEMGGEIRLVSSTEGKGSVFAFYLPTAEGDNLSKLRKRELSKGLIDTETGLASGGASSDKPASDGA